MTLIAYVFSKLWSAKDVVRQMCKKSRLRRSFDKQYVKRSQTLLRSARQQLYHIHWSLWGKLSFKKSFFVICEILGLFLDSLTVDGKYFLLDWNNLTQPIQVQLSKKPNFFVNLFLNFWSLDQCLKILKKKYDPYSLCISEITDCERRG